MVASAELDNFDTQETCEEYEHMFPYEQEYKLWMDAIEADFINEVNMMAEKAAAQDRE